MVVVNSDDEEERKHLLSQDSSPLKIQNGENIVKDQLLSIAHWKALNKLDPVGSTVRYEMMKVCTGSV